MTKAHWNGKGRRKRKSKLRKRSAQLKHAKRRAAERFGITLNRDDIEIIADGIRGNEYRLVKKQSNRVSIFQIKIKGIECLAVYDKQRRMICTFLRSEMKVT